MRPTSPAVAITRTKTANTKKRQRLHLPCPSCQMGGQRTPPWPETREVEEKRARGSKTRTILRLGLLIAGRGRFGDSSYCQTCTRVNIVQVSRSCVRYKGGVVCPFCHHWTRCGPITWVELLFFCAGHLMELSMFALFICVNTSCAWCHFVTERTFGNFHGRRKRGIAVQIYLGCRSRRKQKEWSGVS